MASVYSYAELAGLWLEAGGDGADAAVAAAIAMAESGGCQYAHAGPTDDRPVKVCVYRKTTLEDSYGLWQINRQAHPQYSAPYLYNPQDNARAAVAIRNARGNFTDWTAFTKGTYKQYLQANFTPTIPDIEPGLVTATGGLSLPTGTRTASGQRGYADLRNSVARHLPTQLIRSRKAGAATLRTLAQRRKVGR
jgi:hypothetical protein